MIKKLMPYVLIVAFLVTNACCLHAETESVNLLGFDIKILYYGDFLSDKERADVIKNQKVKLPMQLKSWPPSGYKFSPDNITVKAVFVNKLNKKLHIPKCSVWVGCACLKPDQDNEVAKVARAIMKNGLIIGCVQKESFRKELELDIDAQSEKTIELGRINIVDLSENVFGKEEILPVLFRTQITISDQKWKPFDLPCYSIWEDD